MAIPLIKFDEHKMYRGFRQNRIIEDDESYISSCRGCCAKTISRCEATTVDVFNAAAISTVNLGIYLINARQENNHGDTPSSVIKEAKERFIASENPSLLEIEDEEIRYECCCINKITAFVANWLGINSPDPDEPLKAA